MYGGVGGLTGEILSVRPDRNAETQKYLMQDYALAVYNEAGIGDNDLRQITQAPKTRWRVAGFGLSEAVKDEKGLLSASKAVPGEINAVSRLMPGGNSWLNPGFTRAQLISAMGGGYDVLDVASHNVLDAGYLPNSRL